MYSFSKHLNEGMLSESDLELMNEVAVQFGGKRETQFGQVVIMAGGAGSGKGFIKDKLLDIDGKVFDVDALKTMAMKSPLINKKVKEEFGVELDKLDLKQAEDVRKLHAIISSVGLDKGRKNVAAKSIIAAPKDRKPNLIFDVTLKDLKKMASISGYVQDLGYEKINIHVVWILNKIDVAIKQNKDRPRVVPEDILMDTHKHVSYAMRNTLSGVSKLRSYMDGKFIIIPNQKDVDNKAVASELPKGNFFKREKASSGFYFAKADYYIVKERGKAFVDMKKLDKELMRKIKKYVPNPEIWDND